VNNDFHQGHTIFDLLKGLEVQDLDKVPEIQGNGTKDAPNGAHADGVHTNGIEAST
jgi:methylenetetrahydrofolate reductase (NADPH)